MTNRIRFAITLAGAVLCALPNLAIAQSGSGNSQGDQGAAIEGTWICTVTNPGVSFSALVSFTAGGVALATGSLDRTASSAGNSPLYGSWRPLDNNNTYVSTLNFFQFDSSGNAINMLQNHITYQLTDNNMLQGVGRLFRCDVNGGSCGPPGGVPFTIACRRQIAQGASN